MGIDEAINATMTWGTQFVTWHFFAALYNILDETGRKGTAPGCWVWKYKLRKKDNVTYEQILPRVLFNQVFILLPVMTTMAYFGYGSTNTPMALWKWPVYAYVLGVFHDVVFYFGHRLLHTKWGYVTFRHGLHHSSKAATAASSMYMSSPDFFLEIVLPYLSFFWVVPTSLAFDMTVASVGSIAAMTEHSGYNFSVGFKTLDSRPHFAHHNNLLTGAYAEGIFSPGYMDRIFGTNYVDPEALGVVEGSPKCASKE